MNLEKMYVLIFHIYTRILFWFKYIYKSYIQEKSPFFTIKSVNTTDEDITSYYLKETVYDFKKYSKAIIHWTVNESDYKFILTSDSYDFFPPYSFHTLKTCIPTTKIVSAFLKSKSSENEFDSVGKLVKQLAGPKQNFYRDTEYKIMTSDVWGICDKKLSIITSNGVKEFDLSKDNILEI